MKNWHLIASSFALAAAATATAGEHIITAIPQPSIDRWMYAFDASPGTRPTSSTFGSTSGDPEFDNRDGQIVISFSTQAQVPPLRGATNYHIASAVMQLEVANDMAFSYDDTQDPWTVFIAHDNPAWTPDADPGQPLELFGTGFRNGWTAGSFFETAPYCPGTVNPMDPEVRNAFAAGVNPDGSTFDVSNSVRQQFDPTPFAIGQIDNVTPGSLVPQGSTVKFTLNVSDPGVQAYLQTALNDGKIHLTATSLTFVEVMGGSFPSFIMKEHALVPFGLTHAASLQLEVTIGSPCVAADLDCNGVVDGADLGTLLGQWGTGGIADLDGSGTVDGADLGTLLGAWG